MVGFCNVTTVRYGDKFPISNEGWLVACIVMIAGVGLFGTFTGFVASMFVESESEQEKSDHQQVVRELKALRSKIESPESKFGN